MGSRVATPSVVTAARAGVDGAVGIAEKIVVGGTTLAIGGIFLVLSLLWNVPLERP
jgi:drug/metabolite transporter superfamily protein YnfA